MQRLVGARRQDAHIWDAFGLYGTADGWAGSRQLLRIIATVRCACWASHRVLPREPMPSPPCASGRADFEQATADAGLLLRAAALTNGDAHPQAAGLADLPLIRWRRIGDAVHHCSLQFCATTSVRSPARACLTSPASPLACADCMLAAYGADVMLVNLPHLPNIESIADTSRGKRSAHVDLRSESGRRTCSNCWLAVSVFVQGYRPGGLCCAWLWPDEVGACGRGLSTSRCQPTATWGRGQRRGFDSLRRRQTGFNRAEADALERSTGAGQAALIRKHCRCNPGFRDRASDGVRHSGRGAVRPSKAVAGTDARSRRQRRMRSLGRIEDGFAGEQV